MRVESIPALIRAEQRMKFVQEEGEDDSFTSVYRLRQQRLAAMAQRVVTIDACGSMGSGVILDERGNIATNAHVISTSRGLCGQMLVDTVWGARFEAEFVSGEYEQDVAIIRVQPDKMFQYTEIAPEVFVGQDVYAIGHPLGNSHTVTRGIISYVERAVNSRPYVQTDCAINPGNSGGGLFDELGRLVGLPTFKELWADDARTIPVANIGFAVPGAVVEKYYRRVLRSGEVLACQGDPAAPRQPYIIA